MGFGDGRSRPQKISRKDRMIARTSQVEILIEIINEAAEIISRNPKDSEVLREQKRIFNERVNELIASAEDKPKG